MNKIITAILIILTSSCILFADIVDNNLGRALKEIFPSLGQDYIDLNHNGRLDRLEDMDEQVAESRVKDGIIQIQEVMDFIGENYPFLLIDELEMVQEALTGASGTISELIGLNYSRVMVEIIEKKIALGIDGLYLPPSARKEAEERMYGLIGIMVNAYKNEQLRDERAFEEARDELFTMIEQGYPIVEDMNDEDKDLLVSSLILTTLNERQTNSVRVRYAVKTLGKLRDPFAVSYLIDLMELPGFQPECIDALGAIGNSQAERLLISLAQNNPGEKSRIALYRALGRIGGEESLSLLLNDLKSDPPPGEAEEYAILQSLSTVVQNGTNDRRINPILVEYLSSSLGRYRILAAEGLAAVPNAANINILLTALRNEREEEVQIAMIDAVNIQGNTKVIDLYVGLLRDPAASAAIQIALINAVGDNREGSRALPVLQSGLESENQEIRNSASRAFLNLYNFNPTAVAGTLSRIALTAESDRLIGETAGILARIADPATVNALIVLLKSDSSEARRSATWALYRIGKAGQSRMLVDLNRLITSETEPMEVRINAIRALGSFGESNSDITQTLTTVVKMQGEKYSLLRNYAIETLGELGSMSDETVELLARISAREDNTLIKYSALTALRKGGRFSPSMAETLGQLFNRSNDPEIKTRVLESLGDMGAAQTAEMADSLDFNTLNQEQKLRVLYALTRCGSYKAYNLIISRSQDEEISDVASVLLEEASSDTLVPVVEGRLRSEEDPLIIAFLEDLQAGLEAVF